MPTHTLSVERLTKVFASKTGDTPVTAVNQVSFDIGGDDFLTLLGPSGCGKTTTLRMLAGLESITSGRVLFDGKDFTHRSASERGIGMVFQSYALFPHMTVFENAAYGLRVRGAADADIRGRVARTLDIIGLGPLAQRYPADLSGGQQQRVSIARALVYEPSMLLLDEPLANLDAKLRVQMREEIRRLQKQLGIMTLYVTHDQEEAMSVSDRIGVFNHGRLMQFGFPEEIYTHPASLFVADFIGKANFFKAAVMDSGKPHRVAVQGIGEFAPARDFRLDVEESAEIAAECDGLVLVRPEHLEIRPGSGRGMPCRIARAQFLGSFVRYIAECETATREVTVDCARPVPGITEGAGAHLAFLPEETVLFVRHTAP